MNKKLLLPLILILVYSCNPIYYNPDLGVKLSPNKNNITIVKNPNSSLKVQEISLPFQKLDINIGDFYVDNKKQLKNILANVRLSDNSIENDVDWFISDSTIAKISNYGILTGLKEGNAIVTAISKRDYSKRAKFLLTVYSNNFEPKKCPTKDKIAFISNKDSKNSLYLMDIDGTNQVKIAEDIFIDNNRKDNFSWSPDGTKIFYTTNENTYHILNVDTNLNTKINIESYPFNTIWSPDSSKLAFRTITKNDNQQSEVFIINNDGSNLVKLKDKKFKFDTFYWSPDSKKLLYYYGYNAVSVYNLENQDDVFVIEAKDFCWHPDSSKILFVPIRKELDFFYDDTSSSIFQIDIDGNNKKEFSKNIGLTYSKFSLSTDKKQIAVIGTIKEKEFNSYKNDIYIFSDNGDLIKKLTNNTLLSFDIPYQDVQNGGLTKNYISKFSYTNNPIWINNKTLLVDIRENVNDKYGYGFNKTFIISTETGNMIEVDLDNKKTFSNISDTKIIYSEINNGQNKNISNEVYSFDINSSQIKRITNNNYLNSQKRISDIKDIEITRNPDNELIDKSKLKEKFFVNLSNNPFDGFLITKTNIDDNKAYKIDSFYASNSHLTLSNNREKLAYFYTKSNDKQPELTILDLNSSKKIKINLNNETYYQPRWTLKDEYIIFQSNSISIIKSDGTNFKSLKNIIGDSATFITSSIDNKSIIYYKLKEQSTNNVYIEIFQLNLETMDNNLLFSKKGYISNLIYSNSQDKILYLSRENLYIMNSDGTNEKQITFNKNINTVNYGSISFSPNDKKILYIKDILKGNRTINVIDVDGSNENVLTHHEDMAIKPIWSEDGNYIYYSALKEPVIYYEKRSISLDIGNNSTRDNKSNNLRMIYVMTNEGKNKTSLVDDIL